MKPADGPAALTGILDVSRETEKRLTAYVALVRKWQPVANLVAESTLDTVWQRHVADSAQIAALFPEAETFLDLGSGAGFPGLVVAIVSRRPVDLVESNVKKCAFLRAAVHETGTSARIHEGRIDSILAEWAVVPSLITARALAPLSELLGMTADLIGKGARAAFHKGRNFEREIAEASQSWDFDLVRHASRIDPTGVILEVRRVAPRLERAR